MAYIYGLFDPRQPIKNENCRYIGQTIQSLDSHLQDHIQGAKNPKNKSNRDDWVRSLRADKIEPVIELLEAVNDEMMIHEIECQWIHRGFAEGWPLSNEGTGRTPLPDDHSVYLDSHCLDRFWSKVIVRNTIDCWLWTAYKTDLGYGKFGMGSRIDPSRPRRNSYAHRLAWEIAFGPISNRLYVCHACDNPSCVNPNHLFLDTGGGNMRDASSKGRIRNQYSDIELTHCPQGHLYVEETTFINDKGTVICRICHNEKSRLHMRKVRELDGTGHPQPDEWIATKPPQSEVRTKQPKNPKAVAAGAVGGNAFKRKFESDPEFAAAWTEAQRTASILGKEKSRKKRVQCDECGFISNPQGMGHHQTSLGHSGKTNLEPLDN